MPAAPPKERSVDLVIGGMTCASCAARVEKKLNRLDGVTATVNYATEKAHVVADRGGVRPATSSSASRETGYTAERGDPGALVRPRRDRRAAPPAAGVAASSRSRWSPWRWCPALQFDYWQWVSLALATPGRAVGRLAVPPRCVDQPAAPGDDDGHARSRVGTLAAYGWSLYALVFGTAGEIGMRHAFELTVQRGEGSSYVYFEAAAGVTTFILAGRYLESRSKRQAGAALRALLELGAKSVSVLQPGPTATSSRVCPSRQLAVGMRFVVRPGEKVATDGVVESRALSGRRLDW